MTAVGVIKKDGARSFKSRAIGQARAIEALYAAADSGSSVTLG